MRPFTLQGAGWAKECRVSGRSTRPAAHARAAALAEATFSVVHLQWGDDERVSFTPRPVVVRGRA